MRFRPCIDLHGGRVKQIVGATLSDQTQTAPVTHFVSDHGPAWYAALYRQDGLAGGHVILLGPGNETAAAEALTAWPDGLQVGGGVTAANAKGWLDRGAAKVIVTSFLFDGPYLSQTRLAALEQAVGRDRLVLDLSCRRRPDGAYRVATDRWQTLTDLAVDAVTLASLAGHCSEFLVHAVDVEGRQAGIDQELVVRLATDSPIPVTYAGGARNWDDIRQVETLGRGRVDVTVGSALDLFGGTGLRYADLVAWNRQQLA